MKELVFLPDRVGRDTLTNAAGFVRLGAEDEGLQGLASRLVLPAKEAVRADYAMWRGVLALALLCDAWPEAGLSVSVLTVDGTTSLFSAWVLSARPAEKRRDALQLILLEKGDQRRLLGIADAHAGLILPQTRSDFAGLLPVRAAWYDASADAWRDPVPYLNEHERAILLARLTMMGLDAPEVAAFKADLSEADKMAVEAVKAGDEAALRTLGLRIQAVCALRDFEALTVRQEPCTVEADNALVRVFSGVDVRYQAEKQCSTWLWRGIPFARSSAALGLTGTCDPAQEEALDEIEAEVALLKENSVRWCRLCAGGIDEWLKAQDAALLNEVRAQAEIIRHVCNEQSRQVQMTVTLTWPWDASSGAVRYLLREALGDGWMRGARNPFSDRLTKLTGHVLGDNALQHCCACADGVLLPPLSAEMAMCIASAQDGEGLAADMLRFEPREDGGITASFLLRGVGEVRMIRVYPVEEIEVIPEAASPCVAVWPCLPMERWHAYHVFARSGAVEIAALSGGEWQVLEADAPILADAESEEETTVQPRPWRCLHTESYPACLSIRKDGLCLGALPNALPLCKIEEKAEAQVAIDMGASATATAITLDGKAVPATGEQLTRLLVTPQEMPADDFLLSLTPAELTPSSVALVGAGDELFTDGYVYAVTRFDALQEMQPGSVCTALKWRADARSVRARKILLHQVMLGASLNAMLAGAKSIRWRVTVADEMGDEGREALTGMVEELASAVAQETGLPLEMGKSAVVWAEEAAALHAFLCNEGGMKGTFAVLDVGGGSTKMHLWLQGRNRPVGGAVLMNGSSTTLLAALRENPDMLRADFADCGDAGLMAAVEVLCEQLSRAGESLAQADKALLMLDALLDEYKQLITRHLYARFNAQQPTYMQSVLLEMYAAALFNVGLMLEQAGSDTKINHLFPGDLTICLTGRGAWLLETLTPQLRNALQYIAHAPVSLRHPIRTVTVRPAVLPALGVALGMATLKDTGVTVDMPVIRSRQSFSELMRTLIHQMHQCCPAHLWMLHPGLFDAWGNLVPAAEDTIRRVASVSYGDGEDIPASVMKFIAALRRAEVVSEHVASPGE